MKYIFTLSLFFFLISLNTQAQNKTYYVSASGNDANTGLSVNAAWASINKVNSITLQPGDLVLFEGGKVFNGTIDLTQSNNGTASSPITFSSYGSGKATINADAAVGMYAYNKAGISVRKLIFTGNPATNGGDGISFFTDLTTGYVTNILLDSLEVYGFGGVGITLGTQAAQGYKNVRITHCLVHDNTLAGIFTYGNGDAYSNTGFYIGYCKAYNNLGVNSSTNNTGNGILLSGVDSALVEYSEAYNNGQNNSYNSGGPVGIWVYNSNRVTFQYCESHHNKAGSLTDGGGFDIDGGSQNCTIQYCYSHDNEGAGFALFEYGSSNPFANNLIRYNISQNDGRKNNYGALSFWGGSKSITNSSVYNNTVYVDNTTGLVNGTPSAVQVISGNLTNINVSNNIFYVAGSANIINAANAAPGTASIKFENNNYYAAGQSIFYWGGQIYSSLSAWRTASGQESNAGIPTGFSIDPLLTDPGKAGIVNPADGNSLASIAGYKLQSNSPMIDKGLTRPDMGPHDFFGIAIPYNKVYDIGANEYSVAVVPPPPPPPAQFKFINFTGAPVADHAMLMWKVSNELNLNNYEIQKSTDSITFNTIGNVLATSSTDYNFSDYNFAQSTAQFYRIRAIDNQGNVIFSNIIKLQRSNLLSATVYYKEGSGMVIRITNSNTQSLKIGVYDAAGKQLLSLQQPLTTGDNAITVSEGLKWPKGIYIVHLSFQADLSLKFIK